MYTAWHSCQGGRYTPLLKGTAPPSYKLAKCLDTWFEHATSLRPQYSLRNVTGFIYPHVPGVSRKCYMRKRTPLRWFPISLTIFNCISVWLDGLCIPTGPSLGSLISESFMDILKHEIFHSNHSLIPHFALRRRYVYGIFYVWTGPSNDSGEFHSFINSLYLSIKLMMEIGGVKLNYLDHEIFVPRGKFTFGI